MTNGEKFKDVFGFGADGSRVISVNSTWWDCDFQIRKPKTNADRIRSMTDEELAGKFEEIQLKTVRAYGNDDLLLKGELKGYWLDWLKEKMVADEESKGMLSGDCNICINGKMPSYSTTCVECGLSRKNFKPITEIE